MAEAITLLDPVVIPAVPERTFPKIRIVSMTIRLTPGTPGSAYVVWVPWTGEGTGAPGEDFDPADFDMEHPRSFTIPNLMGLLLSGDPLFTAVWESDVLFLHQWMADNDIAVEPESD